MIKYLNNASNEIEYTNKDGELIVLNPFSPDYAKVVDRLTEIEQNKSAMRSARQNYENAVHDAQRSIDAGRLTVATAKLPPVPVCIEFPEDFHVDSREIPWTPPLDTLHDVKVSPSVGFGPQSPARPPVDPKHVSALERLENLLAELGELSPAIAAILKSIKH